MNDLAESFIYSKAAEFFFFFYFETGYPYVSQAGLELELMIFCFSFLSARVSFNTPR